MYAVFGIFPIFETLYWHKWENGIICVKCRSFNDSIKSGYDAQCIIEDITYVGRGRLLNSASVPELARVATDYITRSSRGTLTAAEAMFNLQIQLRASNQCSTCSLPNSSSSFMRPASSMPALSRWLAQ